MVMLTAYADSCPEVTRCLVYRQWPGQVQVQGAEGGDADHERELVDHHDHPGRVGRPLGHGIRISTAVISGIKEAAMPAPAAASAR